jgi:hypothetical protein
MSKKTTQKQLALYKLIQCQKENPQRLVSAWEFGGEIFVKATGKWELMSYKCPARLSDIFLDSPDIIERELLVGKSGAKYFGYRLKTFSPWQINDLDLREFYEMVVLNEIESATPVEGIKTVALSVCCRAPLLEGSGHCTICGSDKIKPSTCKNLEFGFVQ